MPSIGLMVSMSSAGLASAHEEMLLGATGWATTPASQMLRPLKALDLPQIYLEHGGLIDFALYLVLFNGIAQVAFAKRLPGRGGRLTAGAVGTSLAVALAGFGWTTGFSILSMGPIAAAIILGLFGTVVFRALQKLQVSTLMSGSISVLLVVLSLEAAAPDLASRLSEIFPILDLASAIAILILVFRGFKLFLPRSAEGSIRQQADRIDRSVTQKRPRGNPGDSGRAEPETRRIRKEIKREKPEITHRLRGVVRRESKESRSILRELHLVESVLRDGQHPAKDRHQIAEALRRIPPKRHRLHTLVEEVKELDRRLARFDLGVLHELRTAFNKIPPSQKSLFRRLAMEERKKIQSERRIAVVERFIATYDSNSATTIQKAGECIVKNDIPGALQWVGAAVRYEEEARRAIKRAQSIESMLRRITRLELRQLRRAA